MADLGFWGRAGEAVGLLYGRNHPVSFATNRGWTLATGQPFPDLNCACIAGGEQGATYLLSTLKKFEKLRVPFLICFLDSAVEELGPAAVKFGMIPAGTLSLMTRPIETEHGSHFESTVVRVSTAKTPHDVEAFQRFACRNFGLGKNVLSKVLPRESLTEGKVTYWIAKIADNICGVASTTHHGPCVGIWMMVTDPEKRRQGVATSIIQSILKSAGGADTTYLLATETGIPLYLANGFVSVETGHVYAGRFG